jgi:hypothetical protein
VEQLVERRLAGETEVRGENLAPAPLCPPQISHDQTRARTRTAAVGSQHLIYSAHFFSENCGIVEYVLPELIVYCNQAVKRQCHDK